MITLKFSDALAINRLKLIRFDRFAILCYLIAFDFSFYTLAQEPSTNVMFVAAAGNEGADNELSPLCPSSYDTLNSVGRSAGSNCDSVISVAAFDSRENLASFSHYGRNSLDMGAPGTSIWSTIPRDQYQSLYGTSMSAPHVTGAIAPYASTHLGHSTSEMKLAIFDSRIQTPDLIDRVTIQGRLNLSTIIPPEPIDEPIPPPTELSASLLNGSTIRLTWKDNSLNEDHFRIQRAVGNSDFFTIALVNGNQNNFLDLNFTYLSQLSYRVLAVKNKQDSGYSNVASITIDFGVTTMYVDSIYDLGVSDGSIKKPFPKVVNAFNSQIGLNSYLKIKIFANNYNEKGVFNQRSRLEALGGSVKIGR